MQSAKGITIIQVMAILLVLGLILSFAVNKYADWRCKENPNAQLCADRKAK